MSEERAPAQTATPDAAATTDGGGSDLLVRDPGWNAATWTGAEPGPRPPRSWWRLAIAACRLLGFAAVTLALLPFFFLARLLGRRADRFVAALWCGAGAALCGLRIRRIGRPLTGGGAIMANHASWLDILLMGWLAPVHFVAKAEVEGWPLFGWIGQISNTVFIARRRTEAKAQERHLAARARGGDLLCIFAEGTSTDGLRVLPFKTSLFAMFYTEADEAGAADDPRLLVQPVSIHYRPAAHLPENFYGWWGRMSLFDHLLDVACHSFGGVATVEFHEPLAPASFPGRKELAAEAGRRVSDGRDRAATSVEAGVAPNLTT